MAKRAGHAELSAELPLVFRQYECDAGLAAHSGATDSQSGNPGGNTKGQTVGAPTAYHLYEAWQTTTLECIAAPSTDKGVQEGMLFQESLVMVDPPVYSGWGMLTDQHEQGVHEKWYFAPGIGLVEIQAYNINSNVLAITIKRTDK